MAVPDLGDLISLVGAVASNALALIFPPILSTLVFFRRDHLPWNVTSQLASIPDRKEGEERTVEDAGVEATSPLVAMKQVLWIIKNLCIVLLGLVGFVMGTYATIENIVKFFEANAGGKNTCINFFPH